MKKTLDRAKHLLGVVEDVYTKLEGLFQSMAKTAVDSSGVQRYLQQVLPDPVDRSDTKAHDAIQAQRRYALHLFHHGEGNDQPAVKGTLWAAHNGVTELVDHRKSTLKGPDFTSRRLHSIWFGRGAAIKARALSVATEWMESVHPQ